MTRSVEWRLNSGGDTIVVVDSYEGSVAEAVTPDAATLKDFLAVTGNLDRWHQWSGWHSVDRAGHDPDAWGELVMGRADDGELIDVDPELFWEGVRRWFRVHGGDYNT